MYVKKVKSTFCINDQYSLSMAEVLHGVFCFG